MATQPPVEPGDAITTTNVLLARAQALDAAALGRICDRYRERLVELASVYLASCPLPVVGAEDAAQSALVSFHERFMARQFPDLQDRDGLWNLLACITRRKALQAIRREQQQKRGGTKVVPLPEPGEGESGFADGIEARSREPDPFEEVLKGDLLDQLFKRLTETNRQITLLRLAGHAVGEIATTLQHTPKAVERRLTTIREVLHKLAAED
jgi:RNA polymerase sigma factor (sigma-70 family)